MEFGSESAPVSTDDLLPRLICRPIGTLRSHSSSKFLLAPQPDGSGPSGDMIEIAPEFQGALRDLEGFSRIWVIWWFHKSQSWRPQVLPPRGRGGRKGLFSTRSPHRPNPIAMSAVALLKVEGNRLYIGDHDLLDGTPILDIKPYIPRFDCFPKERQGWFEAVDRLLEAEPEYGVSVSPLAAKQFEWLARHYHHGFPERVKSLLAADPMPHRTRRIRGTMDQGFRLLSGAWRVYFRVEERTVYIDRVGSRFSEGPPNQAVIEKTEELEREDSLHQTFMGIDWDQVGSELWLHD